VIFGRTVILCESSKNYCPGTMFLKNRYTHTRTVLFLVCIKSHKIESVVLPMFNLSSFKVDLNVSHIAELLS
jgi:hypothetical protein